MSVVTHTSVPASAASITVPTPTGELDIAAAYIAINRHRQLVAVRGQYRPPLDLRLRQHRQDHPGRWRGGAHPRHGAQIAARCRTGRGRRRADRGHGPGSIGGSLGGTAQLDGGRPGDPDGGRVTPDHQRRRRARADEPECGACGPAGRHGPGEHGRPWQRRYGFGKHRRRNRRRRAAQAQAHGRRDPAAARRAGPDGQSFAISHTDCVETFCQQLLCPKVLRISTVRPRWRCARRVVVKKRCLSFAVCGNDQAEVGVSAGLYAHPGPVGSAREPTGPLYLGPFCGRGRASPHMP